MLTSFHTACPSSCMVNYEMIYILSWWCEGRQIGWFHHPWVLVERWKSFVEMYFLSDFTMRLYISGHFVSPDTAGVWFRSGWFIDCKRTSPSSLVLRFLMKDSQTYIRGGILFPGFFPICYPSGLQAELANYRLAEFIWRESGGNSDSELDW